MNSPIRIDDRASQRFAAAIAGEKGGALLANPVAAGGVFKTSPPSWPSLGQGQVELGEVDTGGPLGIDLARLFDGRLLIQGASGAGKSWTLRRLLEKTAALIQQVIIDPEGEFTSLAETFDYSVLDAAKLDAAALRLAADRAREHRLSVLIDLSDVDREKQMVAVAAFLGGLVGAPREYWHPVLVVIDEVHLFAPYGQSGAPPAVRKASIDAITDLMSRGRKRGLCGVLATQRLARLAKSVVSEAQNFLIGLNSLDLDIRRAAETIGWDSRRGFDRLPMLSPGEFVAVGPSFSRSPVVMKVGRVETRHRGETPKLVGARPPTEDAAELLGIEALVEATSADAAILEAHAGTPGLKAVRAFVRDPGFSGAGRIWDALRPLYPEGAGVPDLAGHIGAEPAAIADGIALLDRFGLLDFSGEGPARAVRLAKGALL